VSKLRNGAFDAILLASAGVRRLELDLVDLTVLPLPPDAMLPAPGQGALAVEARSGDAEARALRRLHDPAVARCVEAERTLLALLGGGCHLPLGCLATEDEHGIRLQAALAEIDDEATGAEVARVGGVASDPAAAARICFEALRLAMPRVVNP
jgi:porphobilinogen deaminase